MTDLMVHPDSESRSEHYRDAEQRDIGRRFDARCIGRNRAVRSENKQVKYTFGWEKNSRKHVGQHREGSARKQGTNPVDISFETHPGSSLGNALASIDSKSC